MILQNLGNCIGAVSGTALGDCSNLEIGDIKGVGLLNKKTTIATLNKTNFETLITDGKLHQLLGVEDLEVANNENETFTSSQGFNKTIRTAKPTETLTFRKGKCFDKFLATFKSNNKFDIIKYYDNGLLIATDIKGEVMKGFSLGMVDKMLYSHLQGGDPENSKLIYQLINNNELEVNWVYIPYSNLDFNPLEYEGVIETNLEVVSNTGGTMVLKVSNNCNSSISYTSVIPSVTGSFTLSGANIDTISLVDDTIEIAYTGTATSVKLNIVKDVLNNFYKSKAVVLS